MRTKEEDPLKTRKLKVKNDKGQQTTVDIAANSKNVFIDFEDTTLNNEWQLPGKGAKTNLNDALKKTLHIKRTPNSNGTYVIGLDDAKANQPLVGGKANGTILDFNDGGNLTEIISYGVKADGYMSTENVDGTNGKSVPNLDYLNEHYLRADDFDDDSGLTLVAGNGIKLDQDTTKNEIVISATGNTSALNIGGMSTGGVKSDGTPSGLNSNNLFLGDGLYVAQVSQNGVIYPELNAKMASSSQSGMITAADKVKLDGIESGANKYVLPVATSVSLGGIQVTNQDSYYGDGCSYLKVESNGNLKTDFIGTLTLNLTNSELRDVKTHGLGGIYPNGMLALCKQSPSNQDERDQVEAVKNKNYPMVRVKLNDVGANLAYEFKGGVQTLTQTTRYAYVGTYYGDSLHGAGQIDNREQKMEIVIQGDNSINVQLLIGDASGFNFS